ncbi:hypothetical protein ACK3TF_004437 [Chlorella vulgaris]
MQASALHLAPAAAGLGAGAPARPAAARLGRPSVTARAASSTRFSPSTAHSATSKSKDAPVDVLSIAATLGLTGASIGTFMDGIHSRAQVLIYDTLPLTHGGLHTSAVVPPLLAAFYLALGGLYYKGDDWMLGAGDQATQSAYRRCNLGTMCLSFGSVAAILGLSSMLYAADVPADQISWALAFCAAANYLAFDGTKQGLGLALVCALICPASELMLMHILQLWHYPGATLFTEIPHSGIPSWVPWCYFIYTPAVGQLTRFLKKTA